ncbi:hypothetical protein GpartN1_g6650.t1 [Galdieria partita]|uniref:Uncharacterized protein n=1 Tax=Galdieria partita TaxID=83374 RepID=A0A9C7UNA5_9RHOD|nr:hypothetical protein GpartN1_g933.t1 [Galdieria partita]GJQ14859.1 hypothetical protein GpartN1_g6650.t1 [Galdieria partita]
MSASPTAHSSIVELSEKSEFGVSKVSIDSLGTNSVQKHIIESGWRRRVHSSHNVERISAQSLKIVPQRVLCFEKHFVDSEDGSNVLIWLFTEGNIQLYDLESFDCRCTIPLPDTQISYVKAFYSSSGHSLQVPLQIRGVMAVGLKNGDCILYDGYSGTYLQTLSPLGRFSTNVCVSVLGCSSPSFYCDLILRDQELADFLLVGYKDNFFAQWQLDWKAQAPCSSETLCKEWPVSVDSCLKEVHYLMYLRLWVVLLDSDILFMDGQGSVIYRFNTNCSVSQLLLMDSVFLKERKERTILVLTISEEGVIQYYELNYLTIASLHLEPLDSSILSFKDCSNICCFSRMCCNYFILGSSDGSLSLFQWNQTSLGHIMPVCLHKKIIHSAKFDVISCKPDKDGFIIRTYCPVDNQLDTVSIVVKHKPECCRLLAANTVYYKNDSSKPEETFCSLSYEQDVENEGSHYRSDVAFSSNMERAPELSNISEATKQMPLFNHDHNEENAVCASNKKLMSYRTTETEQRLQLLQTEYEYEKKIHQRLREELLNRTLEAEEQVERLEAKLKEMQRMKRYQNDGLREESSFPQLTTPNKDFENERLASLEKQLQEALDSKQLLMAQAKEDINYLQNRVEALDAVLLTSQQDLEDFISTTVEMNERIAEALDGLTDEAFDQLGGFEEVFRHWMTTVRERLYRQRKRKEEIKEEIHTLQSMFRVIDHSSTNMTLHEKTIHEENSPNMDVADTTPRSRLLLHQVKVALQHRIMQLEEQLKHLTDHQSKESDTRTVSTLKELQLQLQQAEQRIHQLEEEKEQIAIAHDRLLEDNAALETENERLQLQLRRAVEAASYYSGRDTVSSPLEPTTPREEHASTSSKN